MLAYCAPLPGRLRHGAIGRLGVAGATAAAGRGLAESPNRLWDIATDQHLPMGEARTAFAEGVRHVRKVERRLQPQALSETPA